jgi:hypothetical protein
MNPAALTQTSAPAPAPPAPPAPRRARDRELVLAEQIAGRSIASADVGERHGRVRLHRPDLAVLTKEAIEVELTPKAPRRLYDLICAWRFAVAEGKVKEVYYLCEPARLGRR